MPALRDHAVDNLRYIRDAMERASAFTSIPGKGGLAIGILALITTAVAQRLAITDPQEWLIAWLICAVLASIIGWSAMMLKARRSGVPLTGSVARRFFVAYFAPMIAGAILTFALWRSGVYQPMPAVWLLLYGTAFVSSGAFSLRVVPIMGSAFMTLGIAAVFFPLSIANLLLGLGFGVIHVVFGVVIARSYGG